jgi:hypothetical protein
MISITLPPVGNGAGRAASNATPVEPLAVASTGRVWLTLAERV